MLSNISDTSTLKKMAKQEFIQEELERLFDETSFFGDWAGPSGKPKPKESPKPRTYINTGMKR